MSSSTEQLAGMAQELQRMMSQFRIGEGEAHPAAHAPAVQVEAAQAPAAQAPGNGRPNLRLVPREPAQAKA